MINRTRGLSVIRFSVAPRVDRTRATKARLRCESLEDRRLLSIGFGSPTSIGIGASGGGPSTGIGSTAEISPFTRSGPATMSRWGGSFGGLGTSGQDASPTTPNMPGGSFAGFSSRTTSPMGTLSGATSGSTISHTGPQGPASSGGQQTMPGGSATNMPSFNVPGNPGGTSSRLNGSQLNLPSGAADGLRQPEHRDADIECSR